VWVETDTLQVVRSWEEIQSGWVGISDNQMAMTRCVWFYDCEPSVEIRTPDKGWKTIASADRHNMPRPQFVSDDEVVLLGRKIVVLRTNGEAVRNEDTPFEGCWWGGVYPAARGHRFAIPSCKAKGGSSFLDLGGREELTKIFVYDAPFQDQPYALDLKGADVKEVSLIALSPDGKWAAYVDHYNLFVRNLSTGAVAQLTSDGERFWDYATPLPSSDLLVRQGSCPISV
jgi:hypothetical protein